jgi:hypothetical protein
MNTYFLLKTYAYFFILMSITVSNIRKNMNGEKRMLFLKKDSRQSQ